MREIKFRAWDKVNKKMHYGVGILGSAIYIDFNGQKEYEEVNGHELMQLYEENKRYREALKEIEEHGIQEMFTELKELEDEE